MVAIDGLFDLISMTMNPSSPLNIDSLKNILNVPRESFPHNGVTFLDCVTQTRQKDKA